MASRKIMIVEDDSQLLAELVDLLASKGFDVRSVSDGEEALAAVERTSPDIILLDLKMSRMNGFTFAGLLHNNRRVSRVPIIAMTGYYTRREDSNLMKAFGITECLTKPFTPDELFTAIDGALGRPTNAGGASATSSPCL